MPTFLYSSVPPEGVIAPEIDAAMHNTSITDEEYRSVLLTEVSKLLVSNQFTGKLCLPGTKLDLSVEGGTQKRTLIVGPKKKHDSAVLIVEPTDDSVRDQTGKRFERRLIPLPGEKDCVPLMSNVLGSTTLHHVVLFTKAGEPLPPGIEVGELN